jgi:hypothetical protein
MTPPRAPFISRVFAALLLRRRLYEDVAADKTAVWQAAAVVCLAAIAQPSVLLEELGTWALLIMMAFGAVRWFLFGGIVYAVGYFVATRPSSYRCVLGCLGFAEAPSLLNVIVYSFDPPFSVVLGLAVWTWLLAAVVVAVRAAFDLTTYRALFIGSASFVFYLAPAFLVP